MSTRPERSIPSQMTPNTIYSHKRSRSLGIIEEKSLHFSPDDDADADLKKMNSIKQNEEVARIILNEMEQHCASETNTFESAVQSERAQFAMERQSYESQIVALIHENNILKESISDRKHEDGTIPLSDAEAQIQYLQIGFDYLHRFYQHQSAHEGNLKTKMQQCMQENTVLNQTNSNLSNEIDELKYRNDRYIHNATKSEEINSGLKKSKKDLSATVAELETRVHHDKLEINRLKNQLEELKQHLCRAQDELSQSNECLHVNSEIDDRSAVPVRVHYTPEIRVSGNEIRSRKRALSHHTLEKQQVCHLSLVRSKSCGTDCNFSGWIPLFSCGYPDDTMDSNDDDEKEEDPYRKNIRMRRSRKDSREFLPQQCENLFLVNEEQRPLIEMEDAVRQCKECMADLVDLHKQEILRIETSERRKYQTKIKQLTKDIYKTHYKTYSGYTDICCEMVGNLGTYTKDAIVYKLTH